MEPDNLRSLNQLLSLLAKGEFLRGMDEYFDDNVVIQEVGQEPKRTKAYCMEVEAKILEGVSEFIQYTALSQGVDVSGNITFYEATMEFKTTRGEHIVQRQCVVTKWQDGKIIEESYYHNNA